ncbi:hypothetical protein J4Q44_G00281900 [Coregonus suidteri]|uniref:Uncharacterized protein n=1 Tax=Coregonus suidteri TaxID=861788 RepID=A0AAN8QU95_9TELE
MASSAENDAITKVVVVEIPKQEVQEPTVVAIDDDIPPIDGKIRGSDSFPRTTKSCLICCPSDHTTENMKIEMEALEEEQDFLRKSVNQLYGQGGQTLSLGPSPTSSVRDNVDKMCEPDNSSDFSSSDSSSSTNSENEEKKQEGTTKGNS